MGCFSFLIDRTVFLFYIRNMTLKLKKTNDPLIDIPFGERVLFYDGLGFDIGRRERDLNFYYDRTGKIAVKVEYIQSFCVLND